MGTFVEVCWPFTTNEPLNALSWLPSCKASQFLRLASQFLRHKRHSSCAVLHATPLRTLIPLCLSVILHL